MRAAVRCGATRPAPWRIGRRPAAEAGLAVGHGPPRHTHPDTAIRTCIPACLRVRACRSRQCRVGSCELRTRARRTFDDEEACRCYVQEHARA